MPRINSAIVGNCNSKYLRNILFRTHFFVMSLILNIISYLFRMQYSFQLRNFIESFSFIPFLHVVRSQLNFLFYHSPSVKKQQSLAPSVKDVASEATVHGSSFLSLAIRRDSANWQLPLSRTSLAIYMNDEQVRVMQYIVTLSLFYFSFQENGVGWGGEEVFFSSVLILCFALSAVDSTGYLTEFCCSTNLPRFLKVFHSMFVGDATEADAIYFQQTIT